MNRMPRSRVNQQFIPRESKNYAVMRQKKVEGLLTGNEGIYSTFFVANISPKEVSNGLITFSGLPVLIRKKFPFLKAGITPIRINQSDFPVIKSCEYPFVAIGIRQTRAGLGKKINTNLVGIGSSIENAIYRVDGIDRLQSRRGNDPEYFDTNQGDLDSLFFKNPNLRYVLYPKDNEGLIGACVYEALPGTNKVLADLDCRSNFCKLSGGLAFKLSKQSKPKIKPKVPIQPLSKMSLAAE